MHNELTYGVYLVDFYLGDSELLGFRIPVFYGPRV